jgi:hypothetical protein
MQRPIRPYLLAGIVLCLGLLSLPAQAAVTPWAKLSPMQQEALSPLSRQWNTLPEKYQHDMLGLTKHYEKLTPEQKLRLRTRLLNWSQLTPQQRARAREKFIAFSKAPPEKREMVKSMVREQHHAASGVTPVTPPANPPSRH